MHRKTGLSPHQQLLLTVTRRYFRCGFICFIFGAVQFLNVLMLTLLCVLLFNLVKLTELPIVSERASNSAYHLLFRYCHDMSVHLSL